MAGKLGKESHQRKRWKKRKILLPGYVPAVSYTHLDVYKRQVLTIGHMEAGFAYNVIPSEALIEGTIRALEEDVRQELARRIKEVAEATARTFRGEVEYEMIWGAPPVISDPEMAALAADCARAVSYTHLLGHESGGTVAAVGSRVSD